METNPRSQRHDRRTAAVTDHHVMFFSSKAIKRFVRVILTLTAVTSLVTPVTLLYYVKFRSMALFIIAVFACCFALALAIATKIKNHEIFAVMAA